VERALPVLELQYVDASGTRGAITVKYPLDTTVAVMDDQASALSSLIAPITGATLIRQRIIYKAAERPRPDADAGSYIFRSGIFLMMTNPPSPAAIVVVPAIIDAVLLTSGPTAGYGIDRSNSDIIAFFDAVIALNATNVFGDTITAIEAAYLVSRS
jgi:hypothetical protein